MIVEQSDVNPPQNQLDSIGRIDQYTQDSRTLNADGHFMQSLLADTLTERRYFQALEIWVQCWRTLELLEQLHRPNDAPLAALPADRCRFAQDDLRALNKHFSYILMLPDQQATLDPAFPFWRKTAVNWYGLVYSMDIMSKAFGPIERHLKIHFSQSFSGDYLSFFAQAQSTGTDQGTDRIGWNDWFNSALADDEDFDAVMTTANDILHWLTRCISTAEPVPSSVA